MSAKKDYGTPEVKKVKLASEEATLEHCKNGPDPSDPSVPFCCESQLFSWGS